MSSSSDAFDRIQKIVQNLAVEFGFQMPLAARVVPIAAGAAVAAAGRQGGSRTEDGRRGATKPRASLPADFVSWCLVKEKCNYNRNR
jgi:hypothetical protein